MFVANFQVAGILIAQGFGRARRGNGICGAVLVGLRRFADTVIEDRDLLAPDHGVFEHRALRYFELDLRAGLFELFHLFLVIVLGELQIVLVVVILRIGRLRHLGLIDIVPQSLVERYDLVAHRFEPFRDGPVALFGHGQVQAGIVFEQRQGLIHEEVLVFLQQAGHVPASAAVAAIGKEHLVQGVVAASAALRLVEVVAVQLGHVFVIKPFGELFGRDAFPRVETVVSEVLFVDLFLNVGIVFSELLGHFERNILMVEHLGHFGDQRGQVDARAHVVLLLAEALADGRDAHSLLLLTAEDAALLHGGVVLALQVLNDQTRFGLLVGHLFHFGRNGHLAGQQRSAETALAVDDLIASVLRRAYLDVGLYTVLRDAVGQVAELLLADGAVQVEGTGVDFVERDVHRDRLERNEGAHVFSRGGGCIYVRVLFLRCYGFLILFHGVCVFNG